MDCRTVQEARSPKPRCWQLVLSWGPRGNGFPASLSFWWGLALLGAPWVGDVTSTVSASVSSWPSPLWVSCLFFHSYEDIRHIGLEPILTEYDLILSTYNLQRPYCVHRHRVCGRELIF